MPKRKLYILFLLLAFAGYSWLYLNYRHALVNNDHFTLCLFKNITGIPCPSCGITRSLVFLARGDISDAFYFNPLGILAAVALVTFPVWIMIDILLKKSSFYQFYQALEKFFRRRWVAIPAILTILIIWITNINKNL